MNHTSAIAAAMIIAFIVFITVRGELSCYLEILGISSGGGCTRLSAADLGGAGSPGNTTSVLGAGGTGPGSIGLGPEGVTVSGPGGIIRIGL